MRSWLTSVIEIPRARVLCEAQPPIQRPARAIPASAWLFIEADVVPMQINDSGCGSVA
jgi:hypothetical protein